MKDNISDLTLSTKDFFERKKTCDKILEKQFIPGLSAVLEAMSLEHFKIVFVTTSQSIKKYICEIAVFIQDYYAPLDSNLEEAVKEDELALADHLSKFGEVSDLKISTKSGTLTFMISLDLADLKAENQKDTEIKPSEFLSSKKDQELSQSEYEEEGNESLTTSDYSNTEEVNQSDYEGGDVELNQSDYEG